MDCRSRTRRTAGSGFLARLRELHLGLALCPALRPALCPALWLALCLGASNVHAAAISDLLILLDEDGRDYVAQHTLASDGTLMVLTLPPERQELDTRFSGPEWLTLSLAHDTDPDRISLRSGSVLTRYRHRYGRGLVQPATGTMQLHASAEHASIQVNEPAGLQWSVTWILPSNATLLEFSDTPATLTYADAAQAGQKSPEGPGAQPDTPAGRWQTSGPVVSYYQRGGVLPGLMIRFSLSAIDDAGMDPCVITLAPSDACSPDIDGDEIPDYRDVCIADGPPVKPAPVFDALGCDNLPVIVLQGIHFQTGLSYLDLGSRNVLDRLALALQRVPDTLFEIGSHTDNAGRVENNQRLSEKRADAIRHYLMLRGVHPNQIRSRGYGETSPAHDNSEPAGRRANRRTELHRLN